MSKSFKQSYEEDLKNNAAEKTTDPAEIVEKLRKGYEVKRPKLTQRVSLVMTDYYYDRLEAIRAEQGKKRNEFINDILEAYIDEHDGKAEK